MCQWSKPSTMIRAASKRHWRIVMQQNYYSTLANVVGISARHDPEKRRAIYALARSELRQQLDRRGVSAFVKTQEMRAFETAIAAIESDLSQASLTAGDYATNDLAVAPSSVEILPPDRPSYLSFRPAIPTCSYLCRSCAQSAGFVCIIANRHSDIGHYIWWLNVGCTVTQSRMPLRQQMTARRSRSPLRQSSRCQEATECTHSLMDV